MICHSASLKVDGISEDRVINTEQAVGDDAMEVFEEPERLVRDHVGQPFDMALKRRQMKRFMSQVMFSTS